jgi:hypothetical protein
MELNIKDIGKKTNNMVKELKPGLMAPLTMVFMLKARSTGLESSLGQMVVLMTANLLTTTLRDKEFTIGVINESTMVTGKITRWRAVEFLNGQMVAGMKVSILMIRKKVSVLFTGPMAVSMRVTGLMESRMVKAHTKQQMVKLKKVNGRTESV